jgi:hypothetical protein
VKGFAELLAAAGTLTNGFVELLAFAGTLTNGFDVAAFSAAGVGRVDRSLAESGAATRFRPDVLVDSFMPGNSGVSGFTDGNSLR